jgi:hypothetical protein
MSEARAAIGRVVRWAARLTSLASATFVALAATVPAAPPTAVEAVALLLFPVGTVVGFGVAWWREGLGGAISVASLAAFYGWMALVRSAPTGPYFVLLTGPGFLFLTSWLLHRPRVRGSAAVRMA